jgi:hypothetical protein
MTRGCKAQERPAGRAAAEGEGAAARGACCGGGEATHARSRDRRGRPRLLQRQQGRGASPATDLGKRLGVGGEAVGDGGWA